LNSAKENIKNILIIKLCCLGDIVFFTPVIENLRYNYPDSKISLLCSSWLKNIVPYLNNIDEVIYYEGPYEKSLLKRFFSTIKTILNLRAKKFDLTILGHRNNFYGLFAKLSGIKKRIGYEGTKYLTDTVNFDSEKHIIEKNLALLKPLKAEIFTNVTKLNRLKHIDELRKIYNIHTDKNIIGVFPFGGVNPGTDMKIKRWDYENYISLVNILSKDNFVILFEGREDGEKIENKNIENENVAIRTMDNDVLSLCDEFVSGDTGPLHIAAAFGVKTVSLFGPSDPELLKPLGENNLLVWKKPACSPCYTPVTASERNNPKYWKGSTFICHTGSHVCMKNISVEEVISSINKLSDNK
jgi:ADP-heptose:LPS heptosyltransferase